MWGPRRRTHEYVSVILDYFRVLTTEVHHAGSPHTGVHEGGRTALHSNTPHLQTFHKEEQVKIYTRMYVMSGHTHDHEEMIVIHCANKDTSLPANAPAPAFATAPAPAPAPAPELHLHLHRHVQLNTNVAEFPAPSPRCRGGQ